MAELPPSPAAVGSTRSAARVIGPSGWLPLGERYVLIAGCRDDESSYEYRAKQGGEVVTHGALTYFLCYELGQAKTGTTYRDVFERASIAVTAAQGRQHPQLEGAIERELFGTREIRPMRFVPVRQVTGDRLTLGAGAAHGLTVGSEWAIYPPGTKRLTADTPRLGLARVAAVRAVTSDAAIVEAAGAEAIVVGARAVEESHAYGEMQLAVEVQVPVSHAAARAELSALIDASRLLRPAANSDEADARVYFIAPRAGAAAGDPVPQLGAVGEPTWAVVDQTGRLTMPLQPVSAAAATGVLCDNLEQAARYRQALALRNPDDAGALQGNVTFVLKRRSPGGDWQVAEPEAAGGRIVYRTGDQIAFEVANHHTAPIYVSILDFGLSGTVSMLHPVAGASEPLPAGRSMEVGVRTGDELTLFFPEDYPFVRDPTDPTPTGGGELEGTEVVKLFATTHAADFGPLVQPGYRSVARRSLAGAGSPLVELLSRALTGQGSRDMRPNRVTPDEEWTTVERSFQLRGGEA